MNRILFLLLFFISLLNFSQNLKGVDTIVLNYKEFETIDSLSNKIKKDFHSDIERVRAIYTWIANNIRYDDLHIETPNRFLYTSQTDLEEQILKKNEDLAKSIFSSKRGICYDYAVLFNKICSNLDIKSEIIKGYAKAKVTRTEAISNFNLINNHAWNKVVINNKPYLIDTTWSLTIIPNKNGYIKDINYDYFLVNPNLFILDHYPENFEDSLIKRDISELSFVNFPRVYLNAYKGIRLIRPIKSKINRYKETNMKFTFQVTKPVKKVSFYLGDFFYSNISYKIQNNVLTFDLDLKNNENNNLTLFINDKAICSYWVE